MARKKRAPRWVAVVSTTVDHPGTNRDHLRPGQRPQQVAHVELLDSDGQRWVDDGGGAGPICLFGVPEVTRKK